MIQVLLAALLALIGNVPPTLATKDGGDGPLGDAISGSQLPGGCCFSKGSNFHDLIGVQHGASMTLSASLSLLPLAVSTVLPHAGDPITCPLIPTWVAHPVRTIDGDGFEAQVEIWPSMEITTKVRLAGIDAPELHRPKCEEERAMAVSARDFLQDRLHTAGRVYLTNAHPDIWPGRVVAFALDPNGKDIGIQLVQAKLAVISESERREKDWCPEAAAP